MITKNLVSYEDRGHYGNNKYRGNCSGRLIKDIIETPMYHINYLSDYMVGSGTTEDVCKEMGINGVWLDLNRGFDMMTMNIPDHPQNIFWHPPYGGMIKYSDNMYKADDIIQKYGFDPRINDLSRADDWDDFIKKLDYCYFKQFSALAKGGRMFILMGDWKQKGRLYSMLCDMSKLGTLENIIVKTQHNCFSDNTYYANNNFISTVTEWLVVCRKDSAIIIPVAYVKKMNTDIRDCKIPTWDQIILAVLEEYGPMRPKQIAEKIKESYRAKCIGNHHVEEKIRQRLQNANKFKNMGNALYMAA